MEKTENTGAGPGPAISASVFERIVRYVADYLKQQGFSAVQSSCEGFTQPARIRWDEEDEGIMPHIVAEHSGAVYVFEVEMRTSIEKGAVEDRWRLLSVHATRHNGKFYLVTPEATAMYLEGLVKALGVRAEFLKLSGVE